MELVPPFVPPLVDHTRYFRHGPARRCKHVWFCMRLRGCLPAEAAVVRLRRYTCWVLRQVDCEGVQERQFYSRDNFKFNRTAALTEWRQLLSA